MPLPTSAFSLCRSQRLSLALALAFALLGMALILSPRQAIAEQLLITGTLYTAEPDYPVAEAVVIDQGRFVFVGSLDEATAMIDEEHSRIDLGSNVAYPGFIEAHGHLSSLGTALKNLDLTQAKSYQDIVNLVATAVANAAPGQVITGRGWHQSKWFTQPAVSVDGFPTHQSLSSVSPNNPVVLGHANGHTALLNAAAMQQVNITAKTPTPVGGVIVKDRRGNPTGILHENAIDLAQSLTADTVASAKAAIRIAQSHALSWGITNFHDAGAGRVEIQAQQELDADHELKLRIYTMVSAQDPDLVDHWLQRKPIIAQQDQRLTIASFKAVMDGALGSRTAWLHQPYSDDPDTSGVQSFDEERLLDMMQRSNANGWQINTHAIGDKANTRVLEAIAKAKLGQRDHRFRIEHAQHLVPNDIQRFADLGVIGSVQTIHLSSDRPWAIARLGKERIESGAYVWRDMLNAGVHLANGSDVPVEPINPIANFYAAVTRKTLSGTPENGFEAAQRLSRQEALASLTRWNAYAGFQEESLGSIKVGKRADLTITNQDLMSVAEDELLATTIAMTIIDGEIVFAAP